MHVFDVVMSKALTYGSVVIVVMVALLVWCLRVRVSAVTVENVNELIRTGIPIGATKDEVYEFLGSKRIAYSGYNAGPDPLPGLPAREREWKRYIVAGIPERSTLVESEYTIEIYLYFDLDYR